MPEYPDITLYVEALRAHVAGQRLERARVRSPYLLRSVEPSLGAAEGRRVVGARNLGKRVVLDLEDDLHLVFHLMVTGRLRWRDVGVAVPKKYGHAAFDFETGALLLTEMGSKKRASLHVVRGDDALADLDPGGLDLFEIDDATFSEALRAGNHTLKRALTDPHRFSGIGNAYSDEILHHAGLSPLQLTQNLSDAQIALLFDSTKTVLRAWTDKLRTTLNGAFPEKVTAFREGMAVHGRYRQPCPKCDAPIQRIVYAENEVNYCARCQTGDKVLADRALSRLLKRDWPRSLDEWEERRPK